MVGRRNKSTNARVRNVPGAEQDRNLRKSGQAARRSLDRDVVGDGLGNAMHGELTRALLFEVAPCFGTEPSSIGVVKVNVAVGY